MGAAVSDRIRCCIAECRRSFKRRSDDDDREIMCGRCWRTADARFIVRYKVLRARWRRVDRMLQRKSTRWRPEHRLNHLFARAIERNWATLKEDVEIKSRMRVEGTAGELAARRAP
jgi:hypothetical protein